MASKTDASDQVKFLVSCISHTNNGRPDFAAVATELSIVSKAAAQKRYERMLKAHNVTTNGNKRAAANEGEGTPSPKKPRTPAGKAAKRPAAKGKALKKEESDDEDTKPPATKPPAKGSKAAKAAAAAAAAQKTEESDEESPLSEAPNSEGNEDPDF